MVLIMPWTGGSLSLGLWFNDPAHHTPGKHIPRRLSAHLHKGLQLAPGIV